MPPDGSSLPAADTPAAWLRHARADLAIARLPLTPEGLWETLAFHAQQAAERAVKAVLIHRVVVFPLTHDIDRLLQLLPAAVVTEQLREAAELTAYAVASRYPAGGPPVTEEEQRRALAQAEAVVQWAEAIVGGRQRTVP
jgi:HEPN domain-containing protein